MSTGPDLSGDKLNIVETAQVDSFSYIYLFTVIKIKRETVFFFTAN